VNSDKHAKQNNMTTNRTKPMALLAAGLLWTGLAHAQQSANTTGGDATGSGGSAAYSVGQTVYTAHTGATGMVAQGVQQPYEFFTTGMEETGSDISLSVYPNPTDDNLTLQISGHNSGEWSYQLFDLQGRALGNGQLTSLRTEIRTAGLPPATYFINIMNHDNRKVQSFKIIKN